MAFKRPRPSSPSSMQKRARGTGGATKTVTLGTELPQDEDGDDGAFVPVWKQTVTDERGRRRLHGAFTGGFSAGYFNTVGSKEGWVPKTFVSSRTHRHKDTTQRAEDYMDEEDLAEAAESRQLETVQSFATIGRTGDAQNDAFFGLFVTEEETMGVKIAQKLGWRRDQGVGRKVHRLARLEGNCSSIDSSSSHLFAPQDSRSMPTSREDVNRKGLGYQSEARLGAVDEKQKEDPPMLALPILQSSKTPILKKAALKKSSFGVGVLNDTGSDDEDPYELGPKITFNKTLGKDKKAKKSSKFTKSGTGEKHIFVPKKLPTRGTATLPPTSYDGKPPLRGFVSGTQLADLASKHKYPPPKVPTGWKSAKATSLSSDSRPYQSVADAAKASTLDAKTRSSLLGESLLPGKSVFDFIPKEARDRLASLTGNTNLPQGLGQSAPDGQEASDKAQPKDLWSFVPVLDKTVASSVLAKGAAGWMPYAEDLKKRARYVSFLELRAGIKNDLPERATGTSISNWAKELQEFANAAQVFKPTTGIMASRFMSSTSASHAGIGEKTTNETLLRQPVAKPEDPAEQAAKLGMYGPMTRSNFPFHPSRLLCKRFNVKPPPDIPYGDDATGAHGSKGRTGEAVSKLAMDQMRHEMLTRGAPILQRPAWMNTKPQQSVLDAPVASPANTTSATEHATVDIEKNEALTQERAPDDVFKAIFGDDDEDEDE